MSKTIENQVVKMEFDNQHFEKNVQTSLSTLDKLKQSLNFKGATDSLNNLEKASSRFNMGGMSGAIETVHAKFSAFEVMSITALSNITNSAVNAGKRIVKALTIDPVTTGFREYETQIGAVQTILANTQHSGTSLEDVNAALDELNTYADKTIYNFTEMTRNIGTFTAAGIELDKSVQSIKGIANLAAVSGSTSQQASTAMYQLSQALAAGRVSLMDWNSVVNAGMGGKLFQDSLKRTAENMGKNVDAIIEKYGSFRESLSKGEWLTTEVLTETLAQLSGAYTEADLIAQGYSEKQAKEIVELSRTADDAATKVKTFTQLFETLKESAQSGWTQTWELIVGDFEESKEFLTSLSEIFGGIINTVSEIRNKILGNALTSKWDQLTKKIEAAGISSEKFDETLTQVLKDNGIAVDDLVEEYGSLKNAFRKGKVESKHLTTTLKKLVGIEEESVGATKAMKLSAEELAKLVDEVLAGKWGDGEERIKALTKAGYDYSEVQNAVNEKLGVSVRHLSKLTEEQKKNADQLVKLTDEQLKQKGYTDEQVKALRELEAAAEDSGSAINDLIKSIADDKKSGRELLIESVLNILEHIGNALEIVKKAWDNVFGTDYSEEMSGGLYGVIEQFHAFSESLDITKEEASNFQSVMEGLFSVFKLSNSVISVGLSSSITILNNVLKAFGTDLGAVLKKVADLTTTFVNWLDQNTIFINMARKISDAIIAIINGIAKCIKAFKELKVVQDAVKVVSEAVKNFFKELGLAFTGFSIGDITKTIENAFAKLEAWIKKLDSNKLGEFFITGLANGLAKGLQLIIDIITNIATKVISIITGIWDEHSPSKKAEEIGENFMVGLYNGLKNGTITVWDALKEFGKKCLEILSKVDYGQVFASGIIVATLLMFKRMLDLVEMLSKPISSLSDLMNSAKNMFSSFASSVSKVADAFSKKIKAEIWLTRAKAIQTLAIAIGILAVSVYIFSKIDPVDLWSSIAAMLTLMAGLAILMKIANIGGPSKESVANMGNMLGLTASLVLIAIALRTMSKIRLEDVPAMLISFAAAIGGLLILVKAFEKVDTTRNEITIVKMGSMLIKLSLAFLVMAAVLKIAATMNEHDVNKAIGVVTAIGLLFGAFVLISKISKDKSFVSSGGALLKMALAMAIMVGVIKLASGLSADEVIEATGVIIIVGGLFAAFIKVSQYAGQHAARAGAMLLMASIALMMMTQVIKVAAGIDPSEVKKGVAVVAALEVLFAGLIWVSKYAGKEAIKAGGMLLLISGALMVLTGVILILSYIAKNNTEGLWHAVAAISVLGIVFMGLIAVTKFAQDVKASLIVITVAIGMLSLLVIALSFIADDAKKIGRAVGAITMIMGVLALLIFVTKYASPGKRALTTLITLTVIVGALTGLVVLLANIPNSDKALNACMALSVLLLSFSASMAILSKFGGLFTIGWTSILKIGAILVIIGAVLGTLADLKLEASITSAIALGILLNAMAAALVILNYVSPTESSALRALAIMGLIVGELGVILGLMAKFELAPSIETAKALSVLILSMSVALVPLTLVGEFASAALAGVGVLAAFIIAFGALIAIVGKIAKETDLEELLNKGIPMLEKVGVGIGSFIGGIGKGITESITSSLTTLGTHLSEFMKELEPFVEGVKALKPEVVEGAETLAKVILVLTGAELMNKLSSFLGGGRASLKSFGKDLAAFGPSFKQFADDTAGINADTVKKSAEAMVALVDVAKEIPNMGGLVSAFTGDNTLYMLAGQLVPFGEKLKEYSGVVAEGINTKAIEDSAIAARAMVDVAKEIPSMGGLADAFAGDSSFATITNQLVPFGKAIKGYSDVIGDGVNVEAIENSAKAAKSIIKIAEDIPNSGGLAGLLAGDNDIGAFGSKMTSFGTSIQKYSSAVIGIDLDSVKTATSAVKSAVKAINSTKDVNVGGVIPFKNAIASLASVNMTAFANAFKNAAPSLTAVGANMIDAIARGVSSKAEKFSIVSMGVVSNAIIRIDTLLPLFKTRGEGLIDKMVDGLSSDESKEKVEGAAEEMAQAGADAASSKTIKEAFYNAGSACVTGFANGISENIYKAKAKAEAMAKAAAQAAEDELDINSPSKVFYNTGRFAGLGFVNALSDYATKAYKASANMATSAKEGLKESISKISNLVDEGIDANPTIRPVLDLTNIKSGIGEMNGMLGQRAVVNAGIVGSLTNLKNQNGINDDVISALSKLREDLSNLSQPSYTVNGITYDDGSAISDAVRTLVRAAKVERRA